MSLMCDVMKYFPAMEMEIETYQLDTNKDCEMRKDRKRRYVLNA